MRTFPKLCFIGLSRSKVPHTQTMIDRIMVLAPEPLPLKDPALLPEGFEVKPMMDLPMEHIWAKEASSPVMIQKFKGDSQDLIKVLNRLMALAFMQYGDSVVFCQNTEFSKLPKAYLEFSKSIKLEKRVELQNNGLLKLDTFKVAMASILFSTMYRKVMGADPFTGSGNVQFLSRDSELNIYKMLKTCGVDQILGMTHEGLTSNYELTHTSQRYQVVVRLCTLLNAEKPDFGQLTNALAKAAQSTSVVAKDFVKAMGVVGPIIPPDYYGISQGRDLSAIRDDVSDTDHKQKVSKSPAPWTPAHNLVMAFNCHKYPGSGKD